jgi:uncharacterized membrane protein YeaQ/YmgE (transglycosylase-associated protein family)
LRKAYQDGPRTARDRCSPLRRTLTVGREGRGRGSAADRSHRDAWASDLPYRLTSPAGVAGEAKEAVVTISGIISALVIGLIIGALGRLVVPGKQDIPVWLTMLVGVIAAVIGTAIVGPLRDTSGIDWIELVVQVVLAAIGVWLVVALRGRARN